MESLDSAQNQQDSAPNPRLKVRRGLRAVKARFNFHHVFLLFRASVSFQIKERVEKKERDQMILCFKFFLFFLFGAGFIMLFIVNQWDVLIRFVFFAIKLLSNVRHQMFFFLIGTRLGWILKHYTVTWEISVFPGRRSRPDYELQSSGTNTMPGKPSHTPQFY